MASNFRVVSGDLVDTLRNSMREFLEHPSRRYVRPGGVQDLYDIVSGAPMHAGCQTWWCAGLLAKDLVSCAVGAGMTPGERLTGSRGDWS